MGKNKAIEGAGNTWKERDSHHGRKQSEEKDVPGWAVCEKRKTDTKQQVVFVHEGEAFVNVLFVP
jgi:hypothetical protein